MKKSDLDTPCIVIDLLKMNNNINRYQKIANDAGVALRPHAKTHKTPEIAQLQMDAGAVGITVAKLGEAEIMADGGIRDIVIAYPIVGSQKLQRLIDLAKRVHLTTVIDSYQVAEGISNVALQAGIVINVWVEIDPGYGRVGVKPGADLERLAGALVSLKGIQITGVLVFAGQSYDAKNDDERREIAARETSIACEAAATLRRYGFTIDSISTGSTPVSRFAGTMVGATEIRPGTYVFGDLTQVNTKSIEIDQCALTVLATIISRPAPDRAVIDAGTKVFTMDGDESPIGTGRGYVLGHPEITVSWFNEEHGILTLPLSEQGLQVGDKLEIVPVHCCAVVNMLDELNVVVNDQVEKIWTIAARGKVR